MGSAQHTFCSCIDLRCFFQSKGPINLSGYVAVVRNGEMKMCVLAVDYLRVGIAGEVGCKEASGVGYNKHLFLNIITRGEQNEWKLGPVELVKVCENHPQGVRFKDTKDAHKCIELMNVRW
ncbi:hypothetical protein MKX03_021191 [Papaver bracteatum]|nr:hypothetical protein MKX03_021191 [Papaver bracteatum]